VPLHARPAVGRFGQPSTPRIGAVLTRHFEAENRSATIPGMSPILRPLMILGAGVVMVACGSAPSPSTAETQSAAVAACASRPTFSTADPCHVGFHLGVVNADSGTRDLNAQNSCEAARPQNVTVEVWSPPCESAFARGEDWYDAR
jgi:hypothetical protein